MYLAVHFYEDGTPLAAREATTARYRSKTIEDAKSIIENAAKNNPTRRFSGAVIDEDTMKIVCWCKYEPRPVVEWFDPSAIELERLSKL